MDFEDMCNLVNDIVENEFNNAISDRNFKKGIYGDKYKKYSEEEARLLKEIKSIIPKDKLDLFYKYSDVLTEQFVIEEREMFRSGVGKGLNQLKYLNDYNLGVLLNEV